MTRGVGVRWLHEHTDAHLDRGEVLAPDGQVIGELVKAHVNDYIARDLEGEFLARSMDMYDALRFFR